MSTSEELHYLDIDTASNLIKKKKLSPVELTDAVIKRIDEVDGRLNAFLTPLFEEAKETARAAEDSIQKGDYLGPLHGIPVAIKDLYDTAGVKTTSCSKVRGSYIPDADSTVVRKLREAGVVILGKVTTHEFAFGFDSPPTRNPWNTDCTPSGSSGGSGAALAAGMCLGATGSDTGGSIRAPAAVNGIAGIKATYGRVSKHGVAVLSWSLDHTGPLARTVKGVALLLEAMAGPDQFDPTTVRDVPVPGYAEALSGDIRGLRIGVPTNYFVDNVQAPVLEAFRAAVATLEGLGAAVVDVHIPSLENLRETFFSTVIPEASAYHQKVFLERAKDYGDDVRFLLETGHLFHATTYINALRSRSVIKDGFRKAFTDIDVLVTPTLPVTAPKVGQESYQFGDFAEPIFRAHARFCCPFNLSGLPAVSVPCGFALDNLPIGLQVVGKPFDEATALRVADAFEKNTDWHKKRQPL